MSPARPLIAGNWKMHGLTDSLDEARVLAATLEQHPPAARVALCPPATLVRPMAELLAGQSILVGGQDCRAEPQGPFTGDLSAEMLADAGATLVILGHSERRQGHGETSVLVAAKVAGALRAGLEPIVCVGETWDERQGGGASDLICEQAKASLPEALGGRAFALAYEPVWAIGSGRTPSLDEIDEVHDALRHILTALFGENGRAAPILYGGSVKSDNAGPILHLREVGGALVGGASLKGAEFAAIIASL